MLVNLRGKKYKKLMKAEFLIRLLSFFCPIAKTNFKKNIEDGYFYSLFFVFEYAMIVY